jgi:3-phosphoshikimate 1-carboxyvinyltransferase
MIARISNDTVSGTIDIPASKSHTIRALLFSALADGESVVANPLDSQDAASCIAAVRAFGASVEEIPGGALGYARALRVRGVGGRKHGILVQAPDDVIDTGNSGTTLYLAAGIAALSPGATVFTGDYQIRSRPIRRLLNALTDLGAEAYTTRTEVDAAPFVIRGPLSGGKTSIECPTSQFLSSLMIAAPLLPEGSEAVIEVPYLMEKPYAEMTERWLRELGVHLENDGWRTLRIPGGQAYPAFQLAVPGDFSSATFFACAAAIGGGDVLLRGLDMDDSQGDKAVLGILEQMGCTVETRPEGVRVSGPPAGAGLLSGTFDLNDIPDSLPALAVTAAYADGETRLVNVPQARLKETDRISCMAAELAKMGVRCSELEDGLVITGGAVRGAVVDGHGDHRIVMACAIAGLASEGSMAITGAEAAAVTFPGFFELLNAAGSSGRTAVLES